MKPRIIQSGTTQIQGKIKRKKPLGVFAGAEAKIILLNNFIIKDRIPKGYRIAEIDDKIRKLRTRSEKKLLKKASIIINVPKILDINNSIWNGRENIYQIKMSFINGEKLSEDLDKFSLEKQKEICRKIGENIAKIHDSNIIHGDLTTSNMILVENERNNNKIKSDDNIDKIDKSGSYINSFKSGSERSEYLGGDGRASANQNSKLFFIDFGLGFISHKIEDMAVDLYLLKEALEAKHFKNWNTLFKEIIKYYKISNKSELVLKQLEKVERRGRYKDKY